MRSGKTISVKEALSVFAETLLKSAKIARGFAREKWVKVGKE